MVPFEGLIGCGVLFAFHSNYGANLYRLRDIATYWPTFAKCLYLPISAPPQGVTSGVAINLIWGVYVLTSHRNFKTCFNVPHVNKTVTDLGVYIPIYPPRYAPGGDPGGISRCSTLIKQE